jgi:hypothetical protein
VGNTDSVPARLTPGEFVIAKDVANRYHGELEHLNKKGRIGETLNGAFAYLPGLTAMNNEAKLLFGGINSFC